MYETILYGVEGRIATITLNRPAKLSAIRPADASAARCRSRGGGARRGVRRLQSGAVGSQASASKAQGAIG